jgi:hypothetical protein
MNFGKSESPEMLDAFNVYLSLGADRSAKRVAARCKKSESWVGKVAAHFSWAERIDQIERESSEKER